MLMDHHKPSSSQDFLPLHGLRGVAALTVVFGHYSPFGASALGVALFFVLSGYLIGTLYIDVKFNSEAVQSYIVARLARIYPLFVVVIVGTALLNTYTSANIFRLDPGDVFAHLALHGSALTVWTISTEFQFYFLFILLWALPAPFKSPLALAVLLVGAFTIAWALGTAATRTGVAGYLHIFLLGIFLARIKPIGSPGTSRIAASAGPLLALAYGVAFAIIPFIYAPRWTYIDPIAIALCGLLVMCVVSGGTSRGINRILSSRLCVYLGEISFGVYLLHRHAQWAIDWMISGPWWVTMVPKIALTLILAAFAKVLIEAPFRAAIRRAGRPVSHGRPQVLQSRSSGI